MAMNWFDRPFFGMGRLVVPAILLAVPSVLFPSDAHAIKRMVATSTSCKVLQSTIERDGAAIVGLRSPDTGNILYDRFVSNPGFCGGSDLTVRNFSVPARDTKKCKLKRCAGRPRGSGR